VVIFDEVHERNLPTDLGLALTLDVAATLRPDLRIVAMSATADTRTLGSVLGDAPVLESAGRMFDVEIRWLPRRRGDRLEPAVVAAVRQALRDEEGDVLVFLPGIGEIMRTASQLRDALAGPTSARTSSGATPVDVHPLAGALSLGEQDAALAPSPPGRRRVVLATDIAETSLTVDGVRVVVDSGLARAPRFDVRTGMTRLTTVTTSRSSAEQRTGRAGRLEPGVCYRLWSKVEHGSRAAHPSAEINEVDLAGLALELAAWGADESTMAFPDPPPARPLAAARELLRHLDALDADDRITDVGRSMLGLPVHPRLARMIVAEPTTLACVAAALLDERDVLRGRPDELPADLEMRVRLVCGTDAHDRADDRAVRRLRDRAADIARRASVRFDVDTVDAARAGATLLAGFPDRLAGRRRPGQFQLRTGSGAWLPDTDPLAHTEFVVAVDLDGRRDRSRIRLAAPVDADDVAARFAADLAETRALEWDADRDDLVERIERRLGSLRLGTVTRPPTPGEATTTALIRRVAATGLAQLAWTPDAVALRQRVEFLNRTIGEPWPDWRVERLIATLDEWLAPYLAGVTDRVGLERVDIAMLLQSELGWDLTTELAAAAPGHLDLPTGRHVTIDYSGETPTAQVRVQDLFGVTEHPTAAGHPIVLHLLSPADRPIQVTSDLPGFWSGSWAEVRKEMAGRYPKHQWPDDPANAAPHRLKDR
ncbi:MAG: ATP-dependent helicase HrpB, partial [Ilumatobacteraceae bacterium]